MRQFTPKPVPDLQIARKKGLISGLHASNFAMSVGPNSPVRKASPYCARLIESYCAGCGLLIAASPSRRVLSVMENLHQCPVYFQYPQPLRRD
jgi:hypothetical protein